MWLLRVLGIWSLLAAMVMLTIDGTKMLAGQGSLVFTPLGEQWYKIHPSSLNTFQAAVERHVATWLWDPAIVTVLQIPGWTFFAVLGLLLYWIGIHRRRREIFSN